MHVDACIVCCLTDLRNYVRGRWAVYDRNNQSQEEQCVPPSTTRGAEASRANRYTYGEPSAWKTPDEVELLHNQHTERSQGHPQESADYQGPDIFVTKRQHRGHFFKAIVGDFRGCNFQECHGVLFLKNRFGTQRACWLANSTTRHYGYILLFVAC